MGCQEKKHRDQSGQQDQERSETPIQESNDQSVRDKEEQKTKEEFCQQDQKLCEKDENEKSGQYIDEQEHREKFGHQDTGCQEQIGDEPYDQEDQEKKYLNNETYIQEQQDKSDPDHQGHKQQEQEHGQHSSQIDLPYCTQHTDKQSNHQHKEHDKNFVKAQKYANFTNFG